MSQALYRKWRPQSWGEVIGQQHVVDTLRNALIAGREAHAYLFAGPRGTGKTTTARLLAKALNCLEEDVSKRPCGQCEPCLAVNQGRFLDLIEIDAASNTSVEDVRDLRDKINFRPNQGQYKVYIIDEVHMLSTAAFNALLKTLEEPPPHAVFILATTEAQKIPATVLSRCQRHEFRRIPVNDIVTQLKKLADDEGFQIEPQALTLIARQSTGAMRDAISLLDQLSSSGQAITLEMAQNVLGTAANQAVLDLIEALIARKVDSGLKQIHAALDAGSDPRQFARQVVDYLRNVLLSMMGGASQIDATSETRTLIARHAAAFNAAEILRVLRIFNQAANDARSAWQPSLPLEMAFIEALNEPGPAPDQETGRAAVLPGAAGKASGPGSRAVRPPGSEAPGERAAAPTAAPEQPRVQPQTDPQATQALNEAWPRLLQLVRQQNGNAYGLLNSAKSRYLSGNELVLSFASDILKNKLDMPENADVVIQALGQVFEGEMRLSTQVDTARRDAVPPGVDNDGMVAAALRDLGGEIVDVQ